MDKPAGTLSTIAACWAVCTLGGLAFAAALFVNGEWSVLQALFGGAIIGIVAATVASLTIARPLSAPRSKLGVQAPTADLAHRGEPGQARSPASPTPRDLNVPSPHKTEIERSRISDSFGPNVAHPQTNKAISPGPGVGGVAEPTPATRIPGPAPVNAADPAVARPVGATTNPKPMVNPAPLSGAVVSPEPPEANPGDPAAGGAQADRNDAAPSGGTGPAPTADQHVQSYNETPGAPATATSAGKDSVPDTAAAREDIPEAAEPPSATAGSGSAASAEEDKGEKPPTLDAPRDGGADDLKRIRGIGPKLEDMLNGMGVYHYDQIARWSDAELAWVDRNLEGFQGRARRDEWISQARVLSAGGETEFSQRQDEAE
jgi:predicted flap endonuclease-1-like 5' DNA nuclease